LKTNNTERHTDIKTTADQNKSPSNGDAGVGGGAAVVDGGAAVVVTGAAVVVANDRYEV
jgi:hypothetical protein